MDCCKNKNIACINGECPCINCGTIHDYESVHENIYREYNMNISYMLACRKSIYRRENIYIKYACILKKLIMTYYYFLIKV